MKTHLSDFELVAFDDPATSSVWRCRACWRFVHTANVNGKPEQPASTCEEHTAGKRLTTPLPDFSEPMGRDE